MSRFFRKIVQSPHKLKFLGGTIMYVGMGYCLTFIPDYCYKPIRPL